MNILIRIDRVILSSAAPWRETTGIVPKRCRARRLVVVTTPSVSAPAVKVLVHALNGGINSLVDRGDLPLKLGEKIPSGWRQGSSFGVRRDVLEAGWYLSALVACEPTSEIDGTITVAMSLEAEEL